MFFFAKYIEVVYNIYLFLYMGCAYTFTNNKYI